MIDRQDLPCCDLRRKLAVNFATAARLFSEAAVDLALTGSSEGRHVKLCEAALAAQQRAESALLSYEEHVDSHRCWSSRPAQAPET